MTALFLAELVAKVSILMGLAVLVSGQVRKSRPAVSHLLLLAVFVGVLLLPAISPLVRSHTVLLLPPERPVGSSTYKTDSESIRSGRPTLKVSKPAPQPGMSEYEPQILLGLWATGFLAVAGRCLIGLIALRRLRRAGSIAIDPSEVSVDVPGSNCELRRSLSQDPSSAMTWGLVRPVVLLPQDSGNWTQSRLEAVLLHEFAHVRRHDFASQLLAEFTCALYWFNPIVWLSARAIRADAELAADEAVIRAGITPSDYAAELLKIAAELGSQRMAPMRAGIPVMNHSRIESRLQSVLSPLARRRGVTMPQALLAISFAGLAVSGIAALHVSQQAPDGKRPATEHTEALIRVRDLAVATLMYAADYDGDFCYAQSTATARAVMAPYVKKMTTFDSPTKGGEFRYNLNIGGVNQNAIDKPAEVPSWTEYLPKGGVDPVAGYLDGHARNISTPEKAAALMEALKRTFKRSRGMKPLPKDYAPRLRG